jgi:branched-chain amino acid transport system permease protein
MGYVSADSYTLTVAISYVAMVLIGGEDSQLGAVMGAAIVTWLPYVTDSILGGTSISASYGPQISEIAYGALVVIVVVYSAGGVAAWIKRAASRLAAVYEGLQVARADHSTRDAPGDGRSSLDG